MFHLPATPVRTKAGRGWGACTTGTSKCVDGELLIWGKQFSACTPGDRISSFPTDSSCILKIKDNRESGTPQNDQLSGRDLETSRNLNKVLKIFNILWVSSV